MVENFDSAVPEDDGKTGFAGGCGKRKTANCVLVNAFSKPGNNG